MLLLGIDLGSSAVKVSVLDAQSGRVICSAQSPQTEMPIDSPHPGWAEQPPALWWQHTALAIRAALRDTDGTRVSAIGISYQMHGLVALDKKSQPVRPAIIWCDSRAVAIGNAAFAALGEQVCRSRLLNSPGNFTASKLRWIQENEPDNFARIHKVMLPGDYIALRLSGKAQTTVSGLSEGTLWDFQAHKRADFLLEHWGIDPSLLADTVPTFGKQTEVGAQIAAELGIPAGTPICYRAGDQPNNAFSLNVMEPGEIAATGGTSGVVYGVSDTLACDPQGRVNGFAHVNHSAIKTRIGVLLCINGTGIQYAWLRRMLGGQHSYAELNSLAANAPAGSAGLTVLPFGNGAERMLGNRQIGSSWSGLDFLRHDAGHLARAAQEGIAFAFSHGIDGMQAAGINPIKIRAGAANLFLSPVFRNTLAATLGVCIELVSTDGAAGAARGAGLGAGIFKDTAEAFRGLQTLETIEPDASLTAPCREAQSRWQAALTAALNAGQ